MYGGGGRNRSYIIICLSLHCLHQNDSCIKMGSDRRYFNVSLIVRDKVTRHSPQTTTFEEKGEPKRIRTKVPLLTPGPVYIWYILLYVHRSEMAYSGRGEGTKE